MVNKTLMVKINIHELSFVGLVKDLTCMASKIILLVQNVYPLVTTGHD